ncbi:MULTISPECIES: helix-turn-helix domain-containing protein [unclassified Arthrobacter]|uniref:helix-turn-helix domain-containing protein n=1 Tax=unclassified Arthrobacter TaxID=235627 RepID=UPI003FA3D7DD
MGRDHPGQSPWRLPQTRKALSTERAGELRRRAGAGEQKTGLGRESGISRGTLYQYLSTDSQAQPQYPQPGTKQTEARTRISSGLGCVS